MTPLLEIPRLKVRGKAQSSDNGKCDGGRPRKLPHGGHGRVNGIESSAKISRGHCPFHETDVSCGSRHPKCSGSADAALAGQHRRLTSMNRDLLYSFHLGRNAVVSLTFETTRIEPDIVIVRLLGSLVAGSEGHALGLLVSELVGQGEKKLIFDLCGIEKIDSVGARFVIQCFFTIQQAQGALRLASAAPNVNRLLSVTRLDTLLPFYRTVAAASEHFELNKRR
jgi:anti-sigma B factor antagonist